ncbi:hypothetical protein JCM18899A_18910 [Nocardioides sp. AN3]
MGAFRKKPVQIEAWLCSDVIAAFKRDGWAGLPAPIEADCDARGYWLVTTKHASEGEGIYIQTLEGSMFAKPDDWIIRGVQGEFYPCKPDIFAATYDAVSDS